MYFDLCFTDSVIALVKEMYKQSNEKWWGGGGGKFMAAGIGFQYSDINQFSVWDFGILSVPLVSVNCETSPQGIS